MAKLPIDISGRLGLLERHQGDLNDTVAQPHLRYLGADGQFAEGIFNPIKKYGFISPANGKYASLTGTIAAKVNAIAYDAENDVVYFSEDGQNILKLTSLSDVSLENHLSLASGSKFKDMQLYELNNTKSLVYVVDTNEVDDGMAIGFAAIDTTRGAEITRVSILDYPNINEMAIVDTNTNLFNSEEARKIAQRFVAGDDTSFHYQVSGVRIKIRRSAGTGAGITLKLSIQGDQTIGGSSYTDEGAWATSTAYTLRDAVSNNGVWYVCHAAHTSSSTDEPGGVSLGWLNYWTIFAEPDGTDQVSATFSLADIPVGRDEEVYKDLYLEFSSPFTLTPAISYWLVLEEVGTNMGSGDAAAIIHTNPSAGVSFLTDESYIRKYADVDDIWVNYSANFDKVQSIDFSLIDNRVDSLTKSDSSASNGLASGSFYVAPNQNTFTYISENNLLYWFVGNRVHTFDGGQTGGRTGRIAEDALSFPSYFEVVDVAETRQQMYIGIQTSTRTDDTDNDYYSAANIGVFVWNRRSQIFGGTDFFPAPGAKEIKKVFRSSDGTIKIITVGNSGFTEIRGINGNQYAVLHTLERDAYPVSRKSVGFFNNLTIWTGLNGITYGYGSIAPGNPEQLYKIGDISGEANDGFEPGPIFVGNNNAEPSSAILQAWSDDDPSYVVSKWYPNGDGTISTVAQTGNAGNVYTKVYAFGFPTIVNFAHVYFVPQAGGDDTTAATVNVYFNHNSTADKSFTITTKDLAKGYVYIPLGGQRNVFAIQFEIEWATVITLGTTDFLPYLISVDYNETSNRKK